MTRSRKSAERDPSQGLVGWFVLWASRKDACGECGKDFESHRQGQIVQEAADMVIVEWFSWLTGEKTGEARAFRRVDLADETWRLFFHNEDFVHFADRSAHKCEGTVTITTITPIRHEAKA